MYIMAAIHWSVTLSSSPFIPGSNARNVVNEVAACLQMYAELSTSGDCISNFPDWLKRIQSQGTVSESPFPRTVLVLVSVCRYPVACYMSLLLL